MITLMSAFPRSIIRRCEQTLLDAEQFPDQLMQDAASKVAEVAEAMLLDLTLFVGPDLFDEDAEMDDPAPLAGYSVLLVVGSGGNGGDALYAGRDLAARGAEVTALILTKAQKRALDAFPGRIVNRIDAVDPRDFDLLVDGVAGLGSTRPLAGEVAHLFAGSIGVPVLSIDVPSGIDADTGTFHPEGLAVFPDVTITFGALRYAHVIAPECGEVIVADIGEDIPVDGTLQRLLYSSHRPLTEAHRAVHTATTPIPPGMLTLEPAHDMFIFQPHPRGNKYTNGVVAVLAGSEQYPGAGVLTTLAALNTNSGLTYYVGDSPEVISACPEVVMRPRLEDVERFDAAVIGPGRGDCSEELAALLRTKVPLVIDADALTALANNDLLKQAVRRREAITILTPHEGEFKRLSDATGTPLERAAALATDLKCIVLLKGRITTIAEWADSVQAPLLTTVDAGSSWGSVPGSGDVLAGVIAALCANVHARMGFILDLLDVCQENYYSPATAVSLHATAAYLSAQTPYGPAPTRATKIAESIGSAIAMQNRGS